MSRAGQTGLSSAGHSPILLGYPGARIYDFDRVPIQEADFESLDHITVVRRFLNDPASEIASAAWAAEMAERDDQETE